MARLRRALITLTLSALCLIILSGGALFFVSWRLEAMEEEIPRTFAPLFVSLERYHAENGRYPATAAELVPRYLDRVPNCPLGLVVAESMNGYRGPDEPSEDYVVECYLFGPLRYYYTGKNHDWRTLD